MGTSRDLSFKIGIGALIAVGAYLLYTQVHPSTTFAANGLSGKWDAAVERSQSTGKPGVVLFTADWCPSCRQLHTDVLSDSSVQDELNLRHTFVTIDMSNPSDRVRRLASQCSISGIPTLIRYDADGKETDRTHGGSPEMVLAWLRDGQ